MAVSKNISKQVKPVARTKRPAPVKAKTIIPLIGESFAEPKQVRQLIVPSTDPVIESVTEPILTEVVSYPEPETTIQVKRAPTMKSLVVGLIGGSIGGYMAYTGLKQVFLDKGYTADQANQYAMYSGVACGLVAFGILYKITKN